MLSGFHLDSTEIRDGQVGQKLGRDVVMPNFWESAYMKKALKNWHTVMFLNDFTCIMEK